jgi:hypothetical protein
MDDSTRRCACLGGAAQRRHRVEMDESDGFFTATVIDNKNCIRIRWIDGGGPKDTATCSFWYRGAGYRSRTPLTDASGDGHHGATATPR